MDFAWSVSQKELFHKLEQFAIKELDCDLVKNDRQGVFNLDGWKKCGELRIQGLAVPTEYGGLGFDPLTTVGALERLGYVCRDNGLLFSLNAHMWTVCAPLVAFGTEEQKQEYLPRLCSGELVGGNAMTETESGSDAYAMATTAVRTGDQYLVNGHKSFVSNGAIADVFTVFAVTDPMKGPAGISAFLVERGSRGLVVSPVIEKMGLRTSPTAELRFENCAVALENRLGREGAGPSLFTHSMNWERGCILSTALGSMQRLLDSCIRYAKTRHQFGKPIGKFQLVASKIVDMKIRLESARLVAYQGAYQRSIGRTAVMEAAMTKLLVSESWIQCCEDAIQIHGGNGYLTSYELERELRDAIGSRLYSGTSEIQRNLIASMLGL